MFQDWTIELEGSGYYTISEEVNGSWSGLLEGYSSGGYDVTEVFSAPTVTVSVVLAGVNYTYRDTRIVSFLTSTDISSVSVTSDLQGSSQILTVSPGQRGMLMFPTWHVSMQSSRNVSYSIDLNGNLVSSGFVSGSLRVSFNVTAREASLAVQLGSKTYSFPGELVSNVPLNEYYSSGSAPAPLVASALQVILAVGAGAGVFGIWMLVGGLTLRPWVMDRMKRRPRYR